MSQYRSLFQQREYFDQDLPSLYICVFGCDKIPKYKDQILKIQDTWGQTAKEHNVRVLFFLGEEQTDLVGEDYINLPGVLDDYLSASYKQFLGLDYIYKNFKPDYVLSCGTDTYVNIPKLAQYVKQFNPKHNLYIGGHGDTRTIGPDTFYFHSGGPGFILTHESLRLLAPLLPTIMDQWILYCNKHHEDHFIPACDVAVAYFLQQPSIHSKILNTDEFYHCNHVGYPCHKNQFQFKDITICHSMSPQDFDEFTRILKQHHYFV